jgi:hypothetical protein
MFEVTKANYHMFLTHHGMNVEAARYVVSKYYNSENYKNMLSVRLWVDASRMLIREVHV